MKTTQSQTNTVATDTEIGSNVVGHSKMQPSSKGEALASSEELGLALEMSKQTIDALKAELAKEKAKNQNSDSVNKLAELLANAVAPKATQAAGPTDVDNLNRAKDYREFANNVDGQYLIDAQTRLGIFKTETKRPISIPKSMQSVFGPDLTISVNGVRVAIPVDGKTYYINKTHWLHARERMAKVDRNANDDSPTVKEINA